jgi:hypothetical protein
MGGMENKQKMAPLNFFKISRIVTSSMFKTLVMEVFSETFSFFHYYNFIGEKRRKKLQVLLLSG